MRSLRTTAFAVGVLLGGTAGAATVDTTTCSPLNVVSCTVPGATVTAAGPTGSVLRLVDFRGNSAIGVGRTNQGGDRPREIEGGTTESLTVAFDLPSFVSLVGLAAFYNDQEFGSDPDEIALITGHFTDGSFKTLSIRNNSNTAGDFTVNDATLFGTITRTSTHLGTIDITDLFDGLGPLTKLVFTAGDTPKGGDNSDYGVRAVAFAPVPLPAPALLLVAGLGALGMLRRRTAA